MMGTHQSLLRHLVFIACAALLAACSHIGRQVPTVFQGKFSPSGKYYAYIYQSVFIFSYQRTGGRSVSNGSLTYYLQVVDSSTGQKLLAKPLKPRAFDCTYPQLGAVSEAHVLIACSNSKGQAQAPFVFSIATQQVTLTGKAIAERNPALGGVHGTDFYRSREQLSAFIMEASDGRKYQLNPDSGTAQPVTGDFERLDIDDPLRGELPKSLREAGDGRRYIEVAARGQSRRSTEDFLRPKYLMLGHDTEDHFSPATQVDGGFLVLSNTVKDSGQHKLLSLVDAATLATRWSTPLPQQRGDWANGFDNEQFVQQGNQLLVANSSQLLRMDLLTGQITRNVDLVD